MSIFGLILCEGCGSIMDEENTENYTENHGPGHLETLSRTTCCKSSYTDVDGQVIVEELMRIRDLEDVRIRDDSENTPCFVRTMVLSQIQRDNLDCVIPVLEKAFDL